MSVRKFRSIDRAADFSVGDFTVLIGPNNQGKSNLLRAAVLAMNIIETWSRIPELLITDKAVPTRYFQTARSTQRARAARGPERGSGLDYDCERD